MSEVIKNCIAHCKTTPNKLILPEGEDPRVQSAAIKIKEQGIASPILIGNAEQITKAASQANNNLSAIEIIDSEQQAPDNQREILIGKKRKITNETVDDYIQLPIYRAVSMLHRGEADAFVAGAVLPTAKVLEASFAVGPKPGIETLSSFFIMDLQGPADEVPESLLFADCALNIAPTDEQLADIAITSAESAAKLMNVEPRVAMLSFSTHGSARHASVSKVASAVQIIRERAPDLHVEGELQVDAALSSRVANTKLADPGEVAGRANVLIFPDLNAGNIAYKLVQYCGGAKATGPILQGFAKPVCDLSRGASVEDIVSAAAVTLTLGGAD